MAETLTKEIKAPKPRFGVVADKGMSSEEVKRILDQRANMLARSTFIEKPERKVQLVAFSLGQENYGLEITSIREIQPLKELTLIPCTPKFIIGAVNIRGKIIAVIDIRKLFGLADVELSVNSKVIVVQDQDLEIGLLAAEVSDVITISHSDIKLPLATLVNESEEYIRGEYVVGRSDMLVVLNVEKIINDQRLIVKEEVSQSY